MAWTDASGTKTRGRFINFSLVLMLLVSTFATTVSPFIGSASATSGTEVVTGNTAPAENAPGWLFNRDLSTSTPYEFSTAQASIGDSSLYVPPIGVNESDKFIAEYFLRQPVANLNSISYDFLIAGNGMASDADDFYLNIYATDTDSTTFYDCRFDYVPTIGSTSNFTTATFAATDTPVNVQKWSKSSRTSPCPATLAEMQTGSYVRAFSISVGQSSASDVGLAGYLDNVIVDTVNGTTTYDFEYHPDPSNHNQLTVSGHVFNNKNSDKDQDAGEERLAGWTMRLYEETDAGWIKIREAITGGDSNTYSFAAVKEAGTYHICEVLSDGWNQTPVNWSKTPFHVYTPNLSGVSGEGEYCSTITYADTSNSSAKKYFGNIDDIKPIIEVVSPAADSIVRGVVDVQVRIVEEGSGLNPDYIWAKFVDGVNPNQFGAVLLEPVPGEIDMYSGQIDTTEKNGTYNLGIDVIDNAGNGRSAKAQNIIVDNKKPGITIEEFDATVSSIDNFKTKLKFTTKDTLSGVDYAQYRLRDATGNNIQGIGWINIDKNFDGQIDVSPLGSDGQYTLSLRAYDVAGNKRTGVDRSFTIDTTAPQTPTGLHRVSSTDTDKTFVCSLDTIIQRQTVWPTWDENTESDFSHYEYTSYSGDTIGINSRIMTTNKFQHSWMPTSDGKSGFQVRAVDQSGNRSSWSDICYVTYDSIAPTAPVITSPSSGDRFDSATTSKIKATWDAASDKNGIATYRIEYSYVRNGVDVIDYREVAGTALSRTQGLSGTVLGDFTIRVQAIDHAGNAGPWSAPVTYSYLPSPEFSKEYFVIDSDGFNVGFDFTDFGTITSVEIELYQDDRLLVTNTGTALLNDLVNTNKLSQLSSPFYLPTTDPTDGYWVFGDRTWTESDLPTHAVVTVVGQYGTATTTITGPDQLETGNVDYADLIKLEEILGAQINRPREGRLGSPVPPESTPFSQPFASIYSPNNTSAPVSTPVEGEEKKVLAESLVDADINGTQDSEDADVCGSFLGICWYWWIPIAVIIVGIVYWLFRPRREA